MRMAETVAKQQAEGSGFIVIEQNLTLIENVSDHLVILDHGEAVREGAAVDLTRKEIHRHLSA